VLVTNRLDGAGSRSAGQKTQHFYGTRRFVTVFTGANH